MFRAFTGALALLLSILVLRLALPEVSELLITIMVKSLTIVNAGLDTAISQTPR